jgi:Protein of unknown function (DUF4239)
MIDWLHGRPSVWLVVVVFGATYLVAATISWVVLRLPVGERARAYKAVSPGLLPPLGVVFDLVVGFLAVQVWNDVGQAQTAVNREASALRSVVLLGASFPGAPQARMRALVRRHIREAVNEEWPAMAGQHATLTVVPASLAEALHLALALNPHSEGEKVAQREMVAALENALDARRERIIVSESRVNWAKWTGVVLLAALTLLAIAFVHSEKRSTTAIAMGIFASAVAVCLLLIASQDRPFAGPFAVKPDALVQVMPAAR